VPHQTIFRFNNKVQSQSLKAVGIDLREEYFSHMWLAQKLALQKAYLLALPPPNKNKTNVVYVEVLCWIFVLRTCNTCILKNN
jgi:hypothetical protein